MLSHLNAGFEASERKRNCVANRSVLEPGGAATYIRAPLNRAPGGRFFRIQDLPLVEDSYNKNELAPHGFTRSNTHSSPLREARLVLKILLPGGSPAPSLRSANDFQLAPWSFETKS